ncbi:unnamed protein product [Calypogeia fissa]
MASSSSTLSTVFLIVLLQSTHLAIAKHESVFCPKTLSRPTCPDLPTYDKFDITTYGGRWFEIGTTANFKNLQESGGICVSANYTLLKPPFSPAHGGAEVKVFNTIYGLGAPSHNVSQVVISISSSAICSQAFSICAETDPKKSSNSSIGDGISLISNVASAIGTQCPNLAESLTSATKKIEAAMEKIDSELDVLAMAVTRIQELAAQLGQGEGNAKKKVAHLTETLTVSNTTTIAIAKAVGKINSARGSVAKVASELKDMADGTNSDTLYKTVASISSGESAIEAKIGQIQQSIDGIAGVIGLFLTPSTMPKAYSGIIGTAEQNVTFAGKLEVTFSGFPPGEYWVLAVEKGGPDGGYAATLVYGCDQNTGGIEETLFILSRTPSLEESVVKRLLAKAAALGVTNYCSTPFIFTVQDPSCGSPPSELPA